MLKIDGLDRLQKELKQAQDALSELDGEIGSVSFDPNDPASLERAISEMERVIDERVGRYANNKIVAPLVEQTKEHFRAEILNKAARARLEADDE
ncbi:MAG: hypothetical protein ACRBCT_04210 [Alphaproteobacteria bacterium]